MTAAPEPGGTPHAHTAPEDVRVEHDDGAVAALRTLTYEGHDPEGLAVWAAHVDPRTYQALLTGTARLALVLPAYTTLRITTEGEP